MGPGAKRESTSGIRWWVAALVVATLAVYGSVLVRLAQDWFTDDNYAHGLLVPPFIAWLLWRRREAFSALERRPAAVGVVIVGLGLLLYLVGQAAFEFFVTRISFVFVAAGAIVYLFGWAHLRLCVFPIVLFVLAIPLPSLVFNQIAFPMQLVASRFGVGLLDVLQVPAVREGNVILLQNATLEVAEACSGVRSLISLGTLALVLAWFGGSGPMARLLVMASVLPAVILVNALRVASAGVMAHLYGAEAASGVLHDVAGWVFFAAALGLIVAVDRATTIWWPADESLEVTRPL